MKSIGHYSLVLLLLLALLALTIGAAYINLGPFNTPVAMTISVAKAALILLFFMHLKGAPSLIKVFAVAGFFWLGIMLTLSMSDYLMR